ncbi:adenylosuccinate synthase [bacterium]|nr:adenylosuccinate synthase [bacterium]
MFFDKAQVVGICGAAWGDEGKGKFTDEFAAEADVIVRAQGGSNAGHTVIAGEVKLALHLVPSGIIHKGKINVVGNGVVLDPWVLVEDELKQLAAHGISPDGLRISGDAHVIMPWHKILDRAREASLGSRKIGTTARGIGPAYADKATRCGIRINELYERGSLEARIAALAAEKEKMIFGLYGVTKEQFAEWMSSPYLMGGAWNAGGCFHVRAIAESYTRWGEAFRHAVVDSRALLRDALAAGRRVLLEGAQGLLLDIDHGTYPFVTSSSCCAGGFATGAGIPPQRIDRIYSVMPAYMTRVGAGPFPTELGTEAKIAGESSSNRMSVDEARTLARTTTDDYSLGKVIRHVAGEFGTTTGRPRRTGWFDAVACRFAAAMNGPDVIISKLDVLDVMPSLKICTAYRYDGPGAFFNGKTLARGQTITEFPTDARVLQHCTAAAFEEMPGWQAETTKAGSVAGLPEAARSYLAAIEKLAGVRVRIVSVGPKRNQTFVVS